MMWFLFMMGCQESEVSPVSTGPVTSIPPIELGDAFLESTPWTEADDAFLRELQPHIRAIKNQLMEARLAGLPESWQSVFEPVGKLERLDVHVGEASRLEGNTVGLRTQIHLHGLGVDGDSGVRLALEGEMVLDWQRDSDGVWSPSQWGQIRVKTRAAGAHYFREVLSDLVTPELQADLERSLHEEYVVARFNPDPLKHPRLPLEFESFDRHPGLAVVDVNQDGWEDIYLLARWGPNQLLINQQGQGFVESAATWGLDLKDYGSSAAFADMDNDGDPDVLIGRTLAPSVLMENVGGYFKPVPDSQFGGELPGLVSSVSVVDFDGDGLLDFYLSTYASSMIEEVYTFQSHEGRLGEPVLQDFVPAADAQSLAEALQSEAFSFFLERPGPRNVLLHNQGGGQFKPLPADHPLSILRNTYQSSWADMDLDGDGDVYLANDFAPNTLLRNEGGGVFTDVTEETGTADFGFGMGVSWGDYDDDGRPDLYVTNMYSRSGRRITKGRDDLDARVSKAARGNSLFRNTEDGFQRVSSLDNSGLQVEQAGWAWGGQFGDVDNDGLEDIYVPNGYYTAPDEVAIDRDT